LGAQGDSFTPQGDTFGTGGAQGDTFFLWTV
jgi:hypothetical protein